MADDRLNGGLFEAERDALQGSGHTSRGCDIPRSITSPFKINAALTNLEYSL